MSNRDGPVSYGELEKEGFVYSNKDLEQYEEISRSVKSLDQMRERGKRHLDELDIEDKKDLSHTGEKIEKAGLLHLGPYDVGGQGILYLSSHHPVDYELAKHPRKKRETIQKEFDEKGGEQFCRDNDLDFIKRIRIVKYMLERNKGDKNNLDRFKREAQVCEALKHENTPHAFYADDESLFFGMPYYHGFISWSNLNGRNERERFEIALNLVKTFAEIEEAAKKSKKRLIHHRDENPNNFMSPRWDPQRDSEMTDEERYVSKIIDWGLATAPDVVDLEEKVLVEITQEGIAAGTALYMPPEIANGNFKLFNTQSQIWGLCASIYHFITGKKTPIRLTDQELNVVKNSKNPNALGFLVIGKQLRAFTGVQPLEERVSVHEANPKIPEGSGLTECLVDRGMAINPRKRHKSIGSLYKSLLKVRKSFNSKKMRGAAPGFIVQVYNPPTINFSASEAVKESVEILQRAKEEGKKERTSQIDRKKSTRTKAFGDYEVKPADTLQKSVDLVGQGLDTQGASTLQKAVDEAKNGWGPEDLTEESAHTLQKAVDEIKKGVEEDDIFAGLNLDTIGTEAGFDETAKTIMITAEEQRKLREARIKREESRFPLAKRPEQSLIKYTPKRWGLKLPPHAKFHKK